MNWKLKNGILEIHMGVLLAGWFIVNNKKEERQITAVVANKVLPKAWVTNFYDTFVPNQTLVFKINSNPETPTLGNIPSVVHNAKTEQKIKFALKNATAQTAHLVFANTIANSEKTKKAVLTYTQKTKKNLDFLLSL